MKVWRHHLFNYLLFTILHKYQYGAHESNRNSCVSKNSHGNAYSEVLGKVAACQHGICYLFRTKIYPDFENTQKQAL